MSKIIDTELVAISGLGESKKNDPICYYAAGCRFATISEWESSDVSWLTPWPVFEGESEDKYMELSLQDIEDLEN